MNETRTQWFSPEQKPIYIGVYERNYVCSIRKCWWDGVCFSMAYSGDYDMLRNFERSVVQDIKWRGLANNPKGKK